MLDDGKDMGNSGLLCWSHWTTSWRKESQSSGSRRVHGKVETFRHGIVARDV